MFDMHYDLLSRLYYDYFKYGYVSNETKNDLKNIYNKDNIIGGFINLYFMNNDEMYAEIGITKDKINVLSMFKKSLELLNNLKQENIFNENTKFIFSIEGCDYIKDEKELEELYNLGLRSILLVWNNKNKYGSGNRSDIGLTDIGKNFIKRAIDLGIIIDVSHANKKTFYDIINIAKEYSYFGLYPIVIASHSNAYDICKNERNLDFDQLTALKNVGGYIGIVGYNPFVGNNDYKSKYIEHIRYMINDIGFDYDKILVSTDNMYFLENYDSTFDIYNINKDLRKHLSCYYDKNIIDNIMYKNALTIVKKIKKSR